MDYSITRREGYADILKESAGKKIAAFSLESTRHKPPVFRITFEDGSHLNISDKGQSCCERRYLDPENERLDAFLG